ncbi:hypothetical protein A4G18_04280 [Pasteurellaceae bacterium Pebbles2]|nr:hypothetical protein [Pasteurellaceae bacterium Pebbles2]
MRKLLSIIALSSVLAACAQTTPTAETKPAEMDYSKFRLSLAEMQDIANENRLAWRIFYAKPSEGADAEWFDAVKQGNLAKVKEMVAKGQNLEAKDEAVLGQTALGWAAFIGYEDMVDFLIKQGADLNATDKGDVYNVMKSAVLGNNTKIVKKVHKLLKKKQKINVNAIEDDGETLVMVAASNNRLDTVKYLVSQGAKLNIVTTTKDKSLPSYDQSAYSYACDRNLPDMQKLLASYGAVNHRTGKASCQ